MNAGSAQFGARAHPGQPPVIGIQVPRRPGRLNPTVCLLPAHHGFEGLAGRLVRILQLHSVPARPALESRLAATAPDAVRCRSYRSLQLPDVFLAQLVAPVLASFSPLSSRVSG